eukprot:1037476_1
MELDDITIHDSDCKEQMSRSELTDQPNSMDIDMILRTQTYGQTTLFSRLRVTRMKSIKNSRNRANRSTKHQSIAQCRIEKDLKEIDQSEWKSFATITTIKTNPLHRFEFEMSITPMEGYYRNGTFDFIVSANKDYPYTAPTASCTKCIFHPNIDPQSKQIGLGILRHWKPVFALNDVIVALQLLFFEPDCNGRGPCHPSTYMVSAHKGNRYTACGSVVLNKCAANLFMRSKHQFDYTVQRIINGCNYNEREWQCCSRSNMNTSKPPNSDRLDVKSNQIMTKKAKILGHRKRRFSEMLLESNINCSNRFVDDQTLFNPSALTKKQKLNHSMYQEEEEDVDIENNF